VIRIKIFDTIVDTVTESFVLKIAGDDAINYISVLAELRRLGLKF